MQPMTTSRQLLQIHYHGPHVWSYSLNRSHSVVGSFLAA
jgi:hypothetical protein